jgi:ABC-type glucose/galactose transport system permease subunit
MIIIMDVITPLTNLPNLKQGQTREVVALEICGIVLDVKARLSAPKETAVSSLFFDSAIIIDCHCNCSHKVVDVVPL